MDSVFIVRDEGNAVIQYIMGRAGLKLLKSYRKIKIGKSSVAGNVRDNEYRIQNVLVVYSESEEEYTSCSLLERRRVDFMH